ncbi:hypothetical protein EV174_000728 [Coemansia sp. RSA 2320]|nr:hypothetical protein EV174_000728 [Coemansia sp. RSA 2320]
MCGALAIIRRQALPFAKAAQFGQRALSTEHRRARELVKFPWIWPSDREQVPQREKYMPVVVRNRFIESLLQKAVQISATSLAEMALSKAYIERVREQMVEVVLRRIVEAINASDYDALSQLMAPHIAKVYKHALANMKAQGYQLDIQIGNVQDPKLEALVVFLGEPESHDVSIPIGVRHKKYMIKRCNSVYLSMTKPTGSTVNEKPKQWTDSVFTEWISVQLRFNITAQVEVSLLSRGKAVDSDQGLMVIPLALSTPSYEGVRQLDTAANDGESVRHLEPFRWMVSDLFNVAEMTEHRSIMQLQNKD